MSKTSPSSVQIMDKEYQVSCPDNQRAALEEAAQHLDRKMREIRDSGKIIGLDRVAVMAALNITHEFLLQKKETGSLDGRLAEQARAMQEQIEAALDK